MSNIFDLFGATSTTTPRNQSKRETTGSVVHSLKSRSFSNNANLTVKNAQANAASKPKGLSLRPPSDPNICNSNLKSTTEKNVSLKPVSKIVDSHSNLGSCTPRNNNEKVSKIARGIQRKVLSPASKSPHSKFVPVKQGEELTFKKPKTPSKINKKLVVYPEPEKLANYYDEKEYDRLSWEKLSLDKELRNLMVPRRCITPFEDEGFISDPETLSVPPLSPVNYFDTDPNDLGEIGITIPMIPVVSEDDDF